MLLSSLLRQRKLSKQSLVSLCRLHVGLKKILIANRGEIAIRIAQAANEIGIETVGITTNDDQMSLHTVKVDECIVLDGKGSAAYLDRTQIINAAIKASCDAIHPGYGFLSENCNFAQQCLDNNIVFIGPTVEQLRILGDKTLAKRLAESCGVPTIKGTSENITLEEAEMFYKSLSPSEHAVIKATYGGGGRGMKIISSIDTLSEDMKHCASEAKAAFGDGSVYIEQLIRNARHIEIQIIGDGNGNVYSLGERECTIQRKYQKIIEYAPSPSIDESMRQTLINASIVMAKKLNYKSLGTFEFLIDMEDPGKYYFIEVNPRLQVEHTVTESVMGIDLVAAQLQLAKNVPLSTLMKDCNTRPNGYCIQTRINMEYLSEEDPDKFTPSGGSTIEVFEPPSGLGIRIDSIGYSGYTTSTNYDSLLAKLIVHSKSPNFLDCQKKAFRALSQFRIEGIKTNIPFLLALLNSPDFRENNSAMHTRYVDNNLRLLASHSYSKQYISSKLSNSSDMKYKMNECNEMGVKNVLAPMQGTILELNIAPGDMVQIGQQLAVMEAMKMQHVISANTNGKVQTIRCSIGDSVLAGSSVLDILESEINDTCTTSMSEGNNYQINLDFQRHDLQEVISRHDCGLDSSRAAAVKKRKSTGSRTARENLSSLYDEGSFVEYGALTIAAQRMRRSMSDLIQNTPADGLVCGIGSVNGSLFPSSNTQCILLSYDYMVLAGTQGVQNHRKKDRMFEIAESMKLPIIILAEGGGGRPGDTDTYNIAGLDTMAFRLYAKLSGRVPRIGIANGKCFAGNAALLGASDVIIATKNSNIGMGGPAMIEGGGLGVFRPEDIGPISIQAPNGVVDIVVDNEEDAIIIAKKYLSYFQGIRTDWTQHDQRKLRTYIPENRLRSYDVRRIIETIADVDSLLELRSKFGLGILTCFARIEGRPVGIIANNSLHLSGAIDSDGSDKAARFMQLCDAFNIPIVNFCDTPGIMVGPESEKSALVRHAARLFVTSANIRVPMFTVVLRKGYGLGAMAMAGGSFKASIFTVSWPTGEFGGMGLEGAVKLGYRKELEAIVDPTERKKAFDARVNELYQHGKAVNYATAFEIDDVIDPAATRHWIVTGLKSINASKSVRDNQFIDTW